jgi:serine/threonine protein kinase
LYDYIQQRGQNLLVEDRINILLQIAQGLSFLHSKKIIHRDLHTKNVLVNSGGKLQVGICDFGLSKSLSGIRNLDERDLIKNTFGSGSVFNEHIAPPECNIEFVDEELVGCTTDVFAFGIVMWQVLTSRDIIQDSEDAREKGEPLVSLICRLASESSTIPLLGNNNSPVNFAFISTEAEQKKMKLALSLMTKCLSTDPKKRPKAASLRSKLSDIHRKKFNNIDIEKKFRDAFDEFAEKYFNCFIPKKVHQDQNCEMPLLKKVQ